jgi:hypothetical protein
MNNKLISMGICLIFLLVILPNYVSSDNGVKFVVNPDNYFHESIWLYPIPYPRSDPPSLRYMSNPAHYSYWDYMFSESSANPHYWDGEIRIEPNENISLSISGITNRIFNPEIKILLCPNYWDMNIQGMVKLHLRFQFKCDGDGDGKFEYIVIFPDDPKSGSIVEPISITGEPKDMTNGTIVLEISNRGNDSVEIFCGGYETYVQVPFDIDSDSDGIGDYSDFDDDNDGHNDKEDRFPLNPKEWKDSDMAGIGDNEDDDDNENGIPDSLEVPLALCILLIPFVVIFAFIRHHKKKSNPIKGGEKEAPQITDSTIGPKNW